MLRIITFIGALSFATEGKAETIHINPGQCVMVGSQQVCATKEETNSAPAAGKTSTTYSCRLDYFKGAEVNNLRSYGLLQINVGPDGKQVETLVKNYGINEKGKEKCEDDAEKHRQEAKAVPPKPD